MLSEHVAGPVAADGAPGVFCCGLRVVSMDESVTDVPDSEKNAAFFGRPSNQSRDGAFPQARWVAAAESGTGSLLGAAIGRYTDAGQVLAADLLGCFGPGMVVLADRKFLSWSAARAFAATGAHILWRASASFTLKPVQVLGDGTYLAELRPPRKSGGPPVTVRVIEYTGDRGAYLGYAMWRRYLKLAHEYTASHMDGIVEYTAHELRHVCASLLIASDATDMQVANQMGHSKVETAKNIYGNTTYFRCLRFPGVLRS
jgi:hypothetical protein